MKTKSILATMLMIFALTLSMAQNTQTGPGKHRGKNPTLQKDGKVVDESGKQLGYITKGGKVCDMTGTTIGIIAKNGDVTTANKKKILGVTKKDGSFESKEGYVISMGKDGVLMHQSKKVGRVSNDYKDKSHACALHCFFSEDNEQAEEIDNNIK